MTIHAHHQENAQRSGRPLGPSVRGRRILDDFPINALFMSDNSLAVGHNNGHAQSLGPRWLTMIASHPLIKEPVSW